MLGIFVSTNGNNNAKYSSPDYDATMQTAQTATDPTERSAALHKAEDILMEDAGCVPIAYYNDFWLQNKTIKDSWHSPYGYWFFMYADVTE
jgi:peptide/nickel transport system substrate-binding protein/oligopeptide transport system substrate-binding protein